MQRLDRVDDRHGGLHRIELSDHVPEVGFGREPQFGHECVEPVGSHAHLLARLFGRDVEHSPTGPGHRGRSLGEQGRLPDTGLATDDRDGARDQPAGQHPVELADSGRRRAPCGHVDLVDRNGSVESWNRLGRGRHHRCFVQRIPRPA